MMRKPDSSRRTKILYLLLGLLVASWAFVYFVDSAPAAQAEVIHGRLVPEDVRRDIPIVLDGDVVAHAQVGNRIFVGGSFQQVQLTDGTVVDQAHLFAYDINTRQFDANFRPVLNNEVTTLETNNSGDGLYVGGRFSRWEVGGTPFFPLRIAKLAADGTLDQNFTAMASAVVVDIEQVGNDLYIGGDFENISGVAIRGLARLDTTTGQVDTTFDLGLANSVAGSQLVRRIEAHPNGNELFVLHYNQVVLGELRRAVFKLDISAPTPVLSGWTIPWAEQTTDAVCWDALRDLAISPDGSFIVIGGQGADRPPNCDSILRYETAGDQVVPFTWSARMYSSIFSLAISDTAVYAGGHFCAAPRLGAVYAGGLTSDFDGGANQCDINDPTSALNPSVRDPENAVFRTQMAALDPATAQALPWDPGSNNAVGVFDLTLIDRGLLAGHDGSRFNQVTVGRSGFFEFRDGCFGLPVTVDIGAGDVPTAGDDVILGTPDDDIILGSTGNDTICGEGGRDTINGGPGDDLIDAGGSSDTIFGLDGNDTIFGGSGLDQIIGGNGNDAIYGGQNADTINGGLGNDVLHGEDDNDALFGQGGDDVIFGGLGDDIILGVDGADTIQGQAGNDVINAGPGLDFANGGNGNDTILGVDGADTLIGGAGNDSIFGLSGADAIFGGPGDDQLIGGFGPDVITDPSGVNILNGGFGDDRLTGGTGDDSIFGDGDLNQAGNDILTGGGGQDLLLGFAGNDTINAQDGEVDTANGGPGTDTCTVDAGAVADTVFFCEQ